MKQFKWFETGEYFTTETGRYNYKVCTCDLSIFCKLRIQPSCFGTYELLINWTNYGNSDTIEGAKALAQKEIENFVKSLEE